MLIISQNRKQYLLYHSNAHRSGCLGNVDAVDFENFVESIEHVVARSARLDEAHQQRTLGAGHKTEAEIFVAFEGDFAGLVDLLVIDQVLVVDGTLVRGGRGVVTIDNLKN